MQIFSEIEAEDDHCTIGDRSHTLARYQRKGPACSVAAEQIAENSKTRLSELSEMNAASHFGISTNPLPVYI